MRMISPPAVERWADKAIGRTIPSLVQTWVAGVRHNEAFVRASEARKGAVLLPTRMPMRVPLLANEISSVVGFGNLIAVPPIARAASTPAGDDPETKMPGKSSGVLRITVSRACCN